MYKIFFLLNRIKVGKKYKFFKTNNFTLTAVIIRTHNKKLWKLKLPVIISVAKSWIKNFQAFAVLQHKLNENKYTINKLIFNKS